MSNSSLCLCGENNMKQKITLVVGALVSFACIYWVLKDVHLSDFKAAVLSTHPLALLASLFFFYWSMYLRAARWGLLFRPNYQLSGRKLIRPIMICFAFNSIMPGRVGEVVRAFYVSKREETGLPIALATVVSERIFDGVTLLLFLAVSLAFLPPIDPNVRVEMGKFVIQGSMLGPLVNKIIVACLILAGGVISLLIPPVERLLAAAIRGFPAMPEGLALKLVEIIRGVVQGFESVRNLRNLAGVVGYSLLLWLLVAVANLALAYGMTGVQNLSLLQSMAIVTLIGIFILIPAAPGYWGLFEAGCVFALKVLGVQSDQTIAFSYAVVMHLVQFVPIVVIGLFFAAQSHVQVTPRKSD